MAQVFTPGVKPTPWNVRGPRDPRIREEWRWAWGADNLFHFITWQGGGSTVFTAGPNRRSGSLENGPSWGRHDFGHAIDYPGDSGNRVNFGDVRPLSGATELTIIGHAYVRTGAADRPLHTKYRTSDDQRAWQLELRLADSPPTLAIVLGKSGGSDFGAQLGDVSNETIVGEWHTYAVRWRSEETADLYVDGTLLPQEGASGANTVTSVPDSSADLWTGSIEFNPGDAMDGFMDMHIVQDRYWTERQIEAIARDPFGWARPRERDVAAVLVAADISNDRLSDMGFCRGAGQYGPGRLPVPDGSIG